MQQIISASSGQFCNKTWIEILPVLTITNPNPTTMPLRVNQNSKAAERRWKSLKLRGPAEWVILLCALVTTCDPSHTHSHLIHCQYKNITYCSFKVIYSIAITLFSHQRALTSTYWVEHFSVRFRQFRNKTWIEILPVLTMTHPNPPEMHFYDLTCDVNCNQDAHRKHMYKCP